MSTFPHSTGPTPPTEAELAAFLRSWHSWQAVAEAAERLHEIQLGNLLAQDKHGHWIERATLEAHEREALVALALSVASTERDTNRWWHRPIIRSLESFERERLARQEKEQENP